MGWGPLKKACFMRARVSCSAMTVLTRDSILHEIGSGRLRIELRVRTEGEAVYAGRFRDGKET